MAWKPFILLLCLKALVKDGFGSVTIPPWSPHHSDHTHNLTPVLYDDGKFHREYYQNEPTFFESDRRVQFISSVTDQQEKSSKISEERLQTSGRVNSVSRDSSSKEREGTVRPNINRKITVPHKKNNDENNGESEQIKIETSEQTFMKENIRDLKIRKWETVPRNRRKDQQNSTFEEPLESNDVSKYVKNKKYTKWYSKSEKKKKANANWVEYDFDSGTSTTTEDSSLPVNPAGLHNPKLLVGPWIEEPTVRVSKARFGGLNNTVVNAQNGTTANLPCVIINRDDHETVSWLRSRDHHLITVGRQTYSSDDRFSVTFNRHLNKWTLHLRYVQPRDEGQYICQLSTDPVMVYVVTLSVTEASSKIEGGPERYVHEGSSVRLECVLRRHTQPPEYVFWYHNGSMINYDTNRKVKVDATADGSILTLLSVGRTDSGNYTCYPANAQQASITLHIILGHTLAAMKVSGTSSLFASAIPASFGILLNVFIVLLL